MRGTTNNNLDIDARNGAILRFHSTGLDNNSGAQLAGDGTFSTANTYRDGKSTASRQA